MTMVKLKIKPLSVNNAWRGRRFKTKDYKEYEKEIIYQLPTIKLPDPPYQIIFEFGLSNKASDWDNPVKPLQDILQKKYKFDDKLIYEGIVRKIIVPKGQEYFSAEINHITTY